MSQRLRLYDIRLSTLPENVGLCSSDIIGIAKVVSRADRRLTTCAESGEEGWWGTWAEMAFNVAQSSPFLVTPRSVARVELVDVCHHPIALQNQFYEFMQFGNGRLPKIGLSICGQRSGLAAYSRNNTPSFFELLPTPQLITIFPTNSLDVGKRVFLQGLDPAGNIVRSLDGRAQVQGVFVVIGLPFVTCPQPFSKITGIQKDVTFGDVQLQQTDAASGMQNSFTTMEAGETTAWYRKYYFNRLPLDCCGLNFPSPCSPLGTTPMVQIHAICKLEPIPVVADPDYLTIQNLDALDEECQSIRYSTLDSPTAKQMFAERHAAAVNHLNGELTHYLGKNEPAIIFEPFGSARLNRQRIGSMI